MQKIKMQKIKMQKKIKSKLFKILEGKKEKIFNKIFFNYFIILFAPREKSIEIESAKPLISLS
jgi:hypothetical protein